MLLSTEKQEDVLELHKNKIVVIGAGNVGEAIAYTLMIRDQANDIVLIDSNKDRAKGAALDIAHGTGFYKNIRVRAGSYEECADARIIIIAAGIARKSNQTRMDLARVNADIVKDVTKKVMQHAVNPLILVVSNPVDIATMVVQKVSGLSPERVIGSGTSLDTARLRYLLSKKVQVNVEDIKIYIIGEHGDNQVPIFSSASIAGLPLADFTKQIDVKLNEPELALRIKNSGAEIIGLKGATFYGIAMAVSNIVESIMKDANAVIPVTHVLDESFKEYAGISISLPCRIGQTGINQTLCIPMNGYEEGKFIESAKIIKKFAAELGLV